MAIRELFVEGYRSVRNLRLTLGRVNVLVGPNGCGKSNLYRSMYLLHMAAHGLLARALAEEGGMPSVLWAGPRGKEPVRLTLGVLVDSLDYTFSCGLPQLFSGTMFHLDPIIKQESVIFRDGRKKTPLLERTRDSVWLRDAEGRRFSYDMALSDSESVIAQLREPHRFPQLAALRTEMLGWRFYHNFRTDPESPMRHPQVAVRTPVLCHDGSDLAAALQTIMENGDDRSLTEAIDAAFPGSELQIEDSGGRFAVTLQMPGMLRSLTARELSDGTLRYLCLLAALLSPRLPPMLALNEPETSLHPELLSPLADLIVRASYYSQLWITTHSEDLAHAIEERAGAPPVTLERVNGETLIAGKGRWDLDV